MSLSNGYGWSVAKANACIGEVKKTKALKDAQAQNKFKKKSGFLYLELVSGLNPCALEKVVTSATIVHPSAFSYEAINEYINNSQCHAQEFTIKMTKLIRFQRKGESDGFPLSSNSVMLWHGTKRKSLQGILKQGLLPPPINSGALMYGNGIYFADRSSKSAKYCDSTTKGQKGYLLLCDVNLGKVYLSGKNQNGFTKPPQGFDTVMGNGKYNPNWGKNKKYYGSILPVGETKPDPKFETYPLLFNEYIVYDTKRILIKFLVEVEFF